MATPSSRQLLGLALAFALGLTLLSLDGRHAPGGPAALPDRPLDNVELVALGGGPAVGAAADPAVVVVTFWATWCEHCLAAIESFNEIHRRPGVEVVGVTVDSGSAAEVREVCEAKGIAYPVTMVSPDILDAFAPLRDVPTTFVIDPRGRVRLRLQGAEPAVLETLTRAVADLVEGPAGR